MSDSAHGDRFLDLARRILAGEAIDESEIREGLKRLQGLLANREHSTETEEGPPPEPPPPPPPPPPRDRSDRFIGDFRLVRKLGEGGMGVVYEAEEQHPRRPVALKVIRGGAHVSPDTLKLFQREAQTLARLRHPGIAALYETGATDDGLHYFAMELVRGVTLSGWLRSRPEDPMTPEELKLRLSVFKKICDAVAYAHQRGVIHRDLKPGNVLIPKVTAGSSMQDQVPDVKVLDFGLARITDSDLQATTYVTEMGKIRGTLPYMSPEQVMGNPDEIDLRTDVYSLGVMLYEMVTGRLPYDLSKAQIPDAVRIICEENPKSISATFTGTKRLDHDVVTIAMKSLEKGPEQRYQSAAALGEEVQRYLTDQPILARPPSAAYQIRKLAARHKGAFAAAAGALVLLIAFSIAMTAQSVRISRERDRANQEAETARRVSEFLESLFEVADPFAPAGKDLSAREMLDAGAERVRSELGDQPAIQMRLMRTIGGVYDRLALVDKARPLTQRAVELAELLHGPESLEVADALNTRGGFGRVPEDAIRAHAIRSKLLKPDDPRMIRSLYFLALAQLVVNPREAEANYRTALGMIERLDHGDERLHMWILNDLGLIESDIKRDSAAALVFFRKAFAIRERIYPEDHPDRIMGMEGLGFCLMEVGELEQARDYLERALQALERKKFPPDHPLIGLAVLNLGELERREGRLDRARSLVERGIAIYEDQIARAGSITAVVNPWGYPEALQSLGLVDEGEGRLDDAVSHLGKAREVFKLGIGFKDPSVDYARVLRAAGKVAEAENVEASLKAASTPVRPPPTAP